MDLFEENEFLDQSLIFQDDQSSMIEDFLQDLIINNNAESDERVHEEQAAADQSAAKEDVDRRISDDDHHNDDMASVFLDWLRTNREVISMEDLRTVKIKKSTIEAAAKRLGGGKEAMKQLLKLVLEWVQTNHLTRRSLDQPPQIRPSDNHAKGFSGFRDANQNPNSGQIPYIAAEKSNPSSNYYFSNPWSHSQPSLYDPRTAYMVPTAPPPPPPPPQQHQFYQSPAGFVGDPFITGSGYYSQESNSRVRVIDFSQSGPYSSSYPQYSQFPDHGRGFGSGHYDPKSHGLNYYNARGEKRLGKLLGSSAAAAAATKEARKKRMARQRSWLMMSSTAQHHQQNQAVDLDLVKYSHRVPSSSTAAAAASTSTSSSTLASSSGPSNVDTSDFVPGGPSATEGREESEVSSTTEL